MKEVIAVWLSENRDGEDRFFFRWEEVIVETEKIALQKFLHCPSFLRFLKWECFGCCKKSGG